MTDMAEVSRRLNMSQDKLGILLEDCARMYSDRSFIRELLDLDYDLDPYESEMTHRVD